MTMVRRVAKALYENSGLTYSTQKYWDDLAKVAIAAMREPDDHMIAGALAQTRNPKIVWQEMIDTALKE